MCGNPCDVDWHVVDWQGIELQGIIFILHYNDVAWVSRKLKPPATWLFVGQHVQADNISIIKTVHYLLFVWLVDSCHKGQVIWKAFLCHDIIMVICRPWVSHQGIYMLNAVFADLQVCSEILFDKVSNEIIRSKIIASRNICETIFISEKVWVLSNKKTIFQKTSILNFPHSSRHWFRLYFCEWTLL